MTDAAVSGTYDDTNAKDAEIVVLYTNDIHGGISEHAQYSGNSDSLGFAGLAAVKAHAAEDAQVVLVDNGDADQGSVV